MSESTTSNKEYKLNLHEARDIYSSIEANDFKDVLRNMKNEVSDFYDNDNTHRFIHEDHISRVLLEELTDNESFGYFSPEFLCEYIDISHAIIVAAQDKELYLELHDDIISQGHGYDLAQAYADISGYGHHFATYDAEEIQVGRYYMFRIG